MELGFKPGWSGYWAPALSDYITVLLLVSQDAGVPPETQMMRVPGSTAVVFMSPLWESGVARVLMSTELVLSSFLHPISEEGLGNSKMKKKA